MGRSKLGVNLESVTDWDRSRMFVNAVKHSRKLGSAATPWDESVGYQYPPGDFGITLATDNVNVGGVYRFSCKGKCTGINGVSCTVTASNLAYDASTNATTATLTVADGPQCFLGLHGANMSDVKVLRPGYADDSAIFTNEFLKALEPFGVIRFMDPLATNNSTVSKWSDRVQLNAPTYSGGIPYEVAIALGNKTGKGIWLNVPHQADDDFITQLATLVKAQLAPSVPVYLEYSNEVWNGQFSQFGWNVQKAKDEVAAGDKGLQFAGGNNNPDGTNYYYWAWARTAKQTVKIAKALKSAGVTNARVILAGQIAWLEGLKVGLQYIKDNHGDPKDYLYGMAGAPYFGGDPTMGKGPLTVNTFFGPYSYQQDDGTGKMVTVKGDNYLGDQKKNTVSAAVKEQIAIAQKWGVVPVSYEGGFDGKQYDNDVWVKAALQSDPRMYGVIADYLHGWYDIGGGEFCYYTLTSRYDQWSYWGLTDDVTKLGGAKYRAAADVAATEMVADPVPQPEPDKTVMTGLTVTFDPPNVIAVYSDGSSKRLV